MPVGALTPCNYPACTALVVRGRCEVHKRAEDKQADRLRGSAHSRGYTSQWAKARNLFLRQHPACAHCRLKGIVTVATQVDHITPHRGNMTLFWDERNWQALCAPCHSHKTATQDGGFRGISRTYAQTGGVA
jgi:5-methylcytosine-specific restriction protein A